MRQIILTEPGHFTEEQAAPPQRIDTDALVRIHSIGVCGTDLHAFAGRQPFFTYPRILGHELGVEIVELPAGDHGLKVGDQCAVEPYLYCGDCHACRQGKTNCCESLQVLGVHCDGGMRPLINVPPRLLHKSDKLSLDQLALVETLGIGAQANRRADIKSGQDVLVVGAGPIGLAVTQLAQAAGANVTVLELSDRRRTFVEGLGVATLDAPPADHLYEVVFGATGNPKAMEAAFEYVAHGGKLVLVGLVQGRISFEDPLLHRREMTVLSSRNSAGLFPKIIDMIETGQIDTAPWITHRMSLADVVSEFPHLREQADLVKAVIEVSDADT